VDNHNPQKAVALISVLWIVTVLGVITMVFTRQSTLSLKINRNINQGNQALMLAEAGIFRLMAELVEDDEMTTFDDENETWSSNQDAFADVPLGRGIYRLTKPNLAEENSINYGGMDESGKLNINTATREMLLMLPEATEETADAIIDWRDDDDNPGAFGAESDYYQSLPEPYLAKNANFDSVEELLLLKGITLEILYGEDINTNSILDPNENDGADLYPIDNGDGQLNRGWYPFITTYSYEKNVSGEGEERINLNSADRSTIEENFSDVLSNSDISRIIDSREENEFESLGDLLTSSVINRNKLRQIIDRISISDEEQLPGRINLNTAPREVLVCLLQENEQLVDDIINYRQSSDGPFETLGDLFEIEGMSNNLFGQISGSISTKSSVFSAKSIGYIEISKAYKEIFAIIDRGVQPPEIRYWKVIR
jgi:DNA uptake protein ComE-like DNA-binding protein